MDSSCKQLRDGFLAAVQGSSPESSNWFTLWQLFLDNEWFQEELRRSAWRLAAPLPDRETVAEDLAQDAVLLLARQLQRKPDLHVDTRRAAVHFEGWMRKIIDSLCRRARRIALKAPPTSEAVVTLAESTTGTLEQQIDVGMALDRLDDRSRLLVTLYRHGYTVQETATHLGESYWPVYRQFHRALEQLRRLLQASSPEA